MVTATETHRPDAPSDANLLDERVWPQGVRRDGAGALEVGGVSARTLADTYGTPLYVMDETVVRSRAKRIREVFEDAFNVAGVSVYYAGKAFLSTEVVRWVTEEGLRVDVCSGGELAVALAAGANPAHLGFHGNNKSLAEIRRAVAERVGTIVLDSEAEVVRVAEAATAAGIVQAVRLRVNSGVHAHTHEYLATAHEDQKFGVRLTDAERIVADIRSHASLDFRGLHCHIGSQIFDAAGFAESASRLIAVHARLSEIAPVPELNLGGGFGIAYLPTDDPADIADIARGMAAAVVEQCAVHSVAVPRVAIEPGRWIVGPAGISLYEVGTIKPVEIESGVRTYVSVDGGMSDNARPALYDADYHVRLASRVSDAPSALVRIAGKHCESGDILVNADYLPGDVRAGDLVAIAATGAYCFSLASNYNFLTRPPVIAVRDGGSRIIVRGETESDLLARDVGVADTTGGTR